MEPINFVSCEQCQSATCFFKQYGSSIDLHLIDSKKNQSEYLQGDYIIHEGAPIHGLFFLQQGKIKIFSSGLNGTPQMGVRQNSGLREKRLYFCKSTKNTNKYNL